MVSAFKKDFVKKKKFVKKPDFDDKLKDLNKKIKSNKTKHLLVENEFQKKQAFESSFFTFLYKYMYTLRHQKY